MARKKRHEEEEGGLSTRPAEEAVPAEDAGLVDEQEDTDGTPAPTEENTHGRAAPPGVVSTVAPEEAIVEVNRSMIVTKHPMTVGGAKAPAGTVVGFISTTAGGHGVDFVAHCVMRGIAKVIPVGK